MSIDNMGKPISQKKKARAYNMLKNIGLEPKSSRYFCVKSVSEYLEKDMPFEAMEKAMKYVDVTASYRLFAELLV